MTDRSRRIIEYIVDHVLRRRDIAIDENTRLVSSGLVDSLALADILLELEDATNLRIPASKVQPKDMDSVTSMLEMAERVGKPRKV